MNDRDFYGDDCNCKLFSGTHARMIYPTTNLSAMKAKEVRMLPPRCSGTTDTMGKTREEDGSNTITYVTSNLPGHHIWMEERRGG